MHRRTPSGSTISDTTCSQVDLNTPPCFPRLCVARPSARPALSRCCTKAPSPLRPVPQVLDLELDPAKGGGGGGIFASARPAPPTDCACACMRVCASVLRACLPFVIQLACRDSSSDMFDTTPVSSIVMQLCGHRLCCSMINPPVSTRQN